MPEEQRHWKTPFFIIWTGQQFSLIGSQLVQFALVWWLTKTTGSATVLATATLVAIIPQVVIGPFAGPLIDRLLGDAEEGIHAPRNPVLVRCWRSDNDRPRAHRVLYPHCHAHRG